MKGLPNKRKGKSGLLILRLRNAQKNQIIQDVKGLAYKTVMRLKGKRSYNAPIFRHVKPAYSGRMKLENYDLKNAGLKITAPRLKILEILEKQTDDRHLSAEQVYKILLSENQEIGLATVYRVLTQFEAAGLVSRHHFEGGNSVFELSTDSHHDHLLCLKCGKVEEFTDEIIETRQKEIADRLGYELTDHSLYLYGICATCKK
jgi:Fur family ferric uptake transcriptional regulator